MIGVATSLGSLEGGESLKAVQMAVDEINAAGGVKVGAGTRPFKVESIDLRDSDPGVPVPEALLGLEKIILEKKPTALMVGPFRSEALIAGMDIIAKYKVPLIHHQKNRKTSLILINQGDRLILKKESIINEVNLLWHKEFYQ